LILVADLLANIFSKNKQDFSNMTVLTCQITPFWRLCKDLRFSIQSGESELHRCFCLILLPGSDSNNLKLPYDTAFSLEQEKARLNVEV
jgi:hypothetical protein